MECLSLLLLVLVPLAVAISSITTGRQAVARCVVGAICIVAGLIIAAWSPAHNGWVCPLVVMYWVVIGLAPGGSRAPSLSTPQDRRLLGGAYGESGPQVSATMDYREPFPVRIRTGTFRVKWREQLFTEFACEVPGATARLVVASREWAGKLRLSISMSPVDRASWPYFVRSNDASFALEVLDEAMRRDVEEADALHSGAFLLDLRPGSLVIRSAGSLEEKGRLSKFTELATRIAGRLRSHGAGMEILEVGGREEGNCRVCGCGLDGGLVRCASCRTPHHEDCWSYNGGCSVYACGGRGRI